MSSARARPDDISSYPLTVCGLPVVMESVDEDYVARLIQTRNIPDALARILSRQGVAEGDVATYLNPTLKSLLPDPSTMAGMDDMAAAIADCLMEGRAIGILADFDVDGATSSAIFHRFLSALGVTKIPVYIPDRLKEGYGPNARAFDTLKAEGAEFVLLMDCGINAHAPIAYAKEIGLSVGIADHHDPADTFPPADFIVDPKRRDDASGLTYLAACGVVFMICVAVNRVLEQRGFFAERGIAKPNLIHMLDLAALGTACDIVPLTGLNRAFVFGGLSRMREQSNAGLRALSSVAQIDGDVTFKDLGYAIGPRINAGSRMYNSRIGFEILSTNDREQASSHAFLLDRCNDDRKAVEKKMVDQALAMVEDMGLSQKPVIILKHPEWHDGVRGLVASKIKERFGRPAIAFNISSAEGDTVVWGGSGRSVEGVDLGHCFRLAEAQGLAKGGGHAMAAGLTAPDDNMDQLIGFLERVISEQAALCTGFRHVPVSGVLTVRAASSVDFFRRMEQGGPYGRDNPAPAFWLKDIRIVSAKVVAERHVFADVSDWEGGARLRLKLWNGVGTLSGESLLKARGVPGLSVIGSLELNRFKGRESVEMLVNYVCEE
jgi:single-stranded-DNA-specific exonuclease